MRKRFSFKNKKKDLFVFDLDGTIVRTKSPMDPEMAQLMSRLLQTKKIAIIGGGKYEVFKDLFVSRLKCPTKLLNNLFLFPTNSTAFYKYNNGWKKVYALRLNKSEIARIKKAFQETFNELGYKHPPKTYGEIIENRGSQVSFSVYGQDLVKVLGKRGVVMKEKWLKENLKLKMRITKMVAEKLPGLEVKAAGYTTIDVNRKGINKAYGIHQIEKYLKIPVNKMFFMGDAIFPGGNDYAVLTTGIDYRAVKDPDETKKVIENILQA